jgi:ankyrin repeat protein
MSVSFNNNLITPVTNITPPVPVQDPYQIAEIAIINNNVAVLEDLVKNKKVDVHRRYLDGDQLIHYASSKGLNTLLELLIAEGADVKAIGLEINLTPLFIAADNGLMVYPTTI